LTREEAICCSTFSQWMPNLDDLANSKRLLSLLNAEQDLNARRKKNANKADFKTDPNKVPYKGKNPNKVKTDKTDKTPSKRGKAA
jgi:hypothetical protein